MSYADQSSGTSSHYPADGEDVEVSGRNKGIKAIDLGDVFSSPEDIKMLSIITSFDLSRNEIETLDHLDALVSLRRLDVSYNMISIVRGLPLHITYLDVSHNKLRSVEGFGSLPNLRELHLNFNRLTSLAGLSGRAPLQILRLDDNRLSSTVGLEDLRELQVLSLSNNFIDNIDALAFLPSVPKLQILNLSKNPVTRVSGLRNLIARMHPRLLTLDGVPLLREDSFNRTTNSSQGSRQHTPTARQPRALLRDGGGSRGPSPHHSALVDSKTRPTAAASRGDSGASISQISAIHKSYRDPRELGAPPPQLNMSRGSSTDLQHPVYGSRFVPPDTPVEAYYVPAAAAAADTVPPPPPPLDDSYAEAPMAERRPPLPSAHPVRAPAAAAESDSYAARFALSRPQNGLTTAATTSAPQRGGRLAGKGRPASRPRPAKEEQTPEREIVRPEEARTADRVAAQLHDCLVEKEQLEKENQFLRQKLKRSEEQLTDSRRVVSEQLTELTHLKTERNEACGTEGELKERLERARRSLKVSETHHRDEVKTLQCQFERMKAFYEAQIADLRRQLSTELSRSKAKGFTSASGSVAGSPAAAPSRLPPSVRQPTQSPARASLQNETVSTPSSMNVSEESRSTGRRSSARLSAAATKEGTDQLAAQLKSWLYSEMATDLNKAEEEQLLKDLRASLQNDTAATGAREQEQSTRALLEAYVFSHSKSIQAATPKSSTTALSSERHNEDALGAASPEVTLPSKGQQHEQQQQQQQQHEAEHEEEQGDEHAARLSAARTALSLSANLLGEKD